MSFPIDSSSKCSVQGGPKYVMRDQILGIPPPTLTVKDMDLISYTKVLK